MLRSLGSFGRSDDDRAEDRDGGERERGETLEIGKGERHMITLRYKRGWGGPE